MNFFRLDHGIASSNFSNPSINNYYRVSMQKKNDFTINVRSTFSNARSLLFFSKNSNSILSEFPLSEFRLAQVLNYYRILGEFDMKQLSSLVHLRHIDAGLLSENSISIPSSISNLWNIGSLMLSSDDEKIHLPETFWRMKSLRHVKVCICVLTFSDSHDHEAYATLDKVVSFSKPVLSTGKDVQQLLQRLPAVRKLSCILNDHLVCDEDSVETLDFHRMLVSLALTLVSKRSENSTYVIRFPSTLQKLTLERFHLPSSSISTIAELQCLQILKLRWNSFPEQILEMEDVKFRNLIFFELLDEDLVEWNASTESLPCLEQLVIECEKLKELPPCFGEISTLKRIVVNESLEVESSALRIWDELMELGNEVEISICNNSSSRWHEL